MRILFTRFPLESTYGGAEVQTLSLMKGLRKRGHEVGFLGSCPILLQEGVRVDIGKPPVTKWGAISFLWRQRAMRRALIAQLSARRPPPAALFMLSLSEKLLLTDWAVAHGIRVFWIEHDRVGRWLRWNPWLPRLRRLSKLATTVVVSDLSKRIYTGLGWVPERIAVIPNGIDLRRLGTRDWELGTGNITEEITRAPGPRPQAPGFRVGTIARLSPEKGLDLLIEAIRDLPNIHLTIVGTGREENRLRQFAQRVTSPSTPLPFRARAFSSSPSLRAEGWAEGRTGNEQRVTIIQSVPDVAAFYRSLDLFVLPSRDHDPCPLAPMEAMACGIPVIMTDACGTAEYVENGKEAIVVPAGSAEALREAIGRVMSYEVRVMLRRHGLEAARKKFSLERMVEEYEKLFTENGATLSSPPPRGEG